MKKETIERLIVDAKTQEEVIAAIAPGELTPREHALFIAALAFSTRKDKPVSKTTTYTAEFNHDADTLSDAISIDIDSFKLKFDDLLSDFEIAKLKFEQRMRRFDGEDKQEYASKLKLELGLNKSHAFERILNTFETDIERMFAVSVMTETPFL